MYVCMYVCISSQYNTGLYSSVHQAYSKNAFWSYPTQVVWRNAPSGNILKVVELTGEDAEVIYGEWDQSGENTISFLILEKSSAILTAMSMLTHLPISKMILLLSKWMTVFYHQCKIDGELILLVSQLEDHHQWVTTQAGQTEYHITS